LIQAGFSSRLAAIKAVNDTAAAFSNGAELQQWLASNAVKALSAQPDWPTAEIKAMWSSFVASFAPRTSNTWKEHRYWAGVQWHAGVQPPPGTPLRLHHHRGKPIVLSHDGLPIGELNAPLNPFRRGLVRASVRPEPGRIELSYLGLDDLWLFAQQARIGFSVHTAVKIRWDNGLSDAICHNDMASVTFAPVKS
jgi:hypothetical protein